MAISRMLQGQLLDLLMMLPISGGSVSASVRVNALLFGLPESLVRSVPRHDDALPHLSAMITHLKRWAEVEEQIDVLVALIDNARRATDSQKVSQDLAAVRGEVIRSIENVPDSTTPVTAQGLERQVVAAVELLPYSTLAEALDVARPVARLKFPYFSGGISTSGYSLGTGWLVAPGLLLTNHHVIAGASSGIQMDLSDLELQVQGGIAWFDYVSYNNLYYEYCCQELVACDGTLDYALISLDPVCRNDPERLLSDWGYLEVYETRPTLNSGTRLNIIQHPGGGIKQFGIRSNHYVSPADPKSPYVQYTTHTEAGSSGSPVFDDRWRVIAIHHRWVQVEQHTYQGESVQYHNQGVYLDSVLKDIASKSPAMYEQICQAQEECRS